MIRRDGRAIESTINDWIADIIADSRWCTARAERTRTVSGKRGARPDIIVRPTGVGSANRAVIIELETDKNNLESEVEDRIGITLGDGNVTPSCIIGVLFPDDLTHVEDRDAFRTILKDQ